MIIGTYSGPPLPYGGSASANRYSTIQELLNKIPDNSANQIKAKDIRDSIYTLWEKVSGITASANALLDIKNYIAPADNITIPAGYEYWIYGDLTIEGQLNNQGTLIVANGDIIYLGTGALVNSGAGTNSFVSLAGTGSFHDSSTVGYVVEGSRTEAGLSVSSYIIDGSLTASSLNTNGAGATAGYLLSVDSNGVFNWVDSNFNLSVSDYNTGLTYSNIENIIFRGGVVSVPGSTAGGVLVTPNDPVTVTVWIPKPDYVGYFTPVLNTSATSRYIATPTSNTYSSVPGNTGSYATGDWSTVNDFGTNTPRFVTGNSTSIISSAFSEAVFACYDLNTTLQFELFDSDNVEIRGITISLTGTGTFNSTNPGLSINVSSFTPDNDRYKSTVSGSIDLASIFPNGGKYKGWRVTHYNSGDGPGAGSPLVAGVYKYDTRDTIDGFFWDNDLSPSSSGLNGTTVFDELTPTLVYYSGVAFYYLGSSFALTASTVDLLNDITFPTSPQIDFVTTNMASSTTLNGHSDGTKGYSAITGWDLSWDKSGLTYSRTATSTDVGTAPGSPPYIPGYVYPSLITTPSSFTSSNDISTSAQSYVTSRIYDWSLVTTQNSSAKKMLFDTSSPSTPSYNNNYIDGEIGRLSATNVFSNGSSTFSSISTLPSDELQYIWGRIVYPNRDYTTFFPLINSTLSVDYSSLSGASKTFTIYTSLGVVPTTAGKTFSNHRWFVTSYTKGGSSFTSGIFTFNSNFRESFLGYDGVLNNGSGTGDLEILVGHDSTGTNTTPDKFFYLTGNYNTTDSPGRTGASLYNLNSGYPNPSSSKQIQFDKKAYTAYTNKVWLFIGYKNTDVGKALWVTNIGLT